MDCRHRQHNTRGLGALVAGFGSLVTGFGALGAGFGALVGGVGTLGAGCIMSTAIVARADAPAPPPKRADHPRAANAAANAAANGPAKSADSAAHALANSADSAASPPADSAPNSANSAADSTRPRPDFSGEKRSGIASFYADSFFGRTMADGTPMDPNGANAASRTLPLGTKAKVTNLETGKSATVVIQDRGPYVDGRIVDLSPATARRIGITQKKGISRVIVAPISVPQPDGTVKQGVAARETAASATPDSQARPLREASLEGSAKQTARR